MDESDVPASAAIQPARFVDTEKAGKKKSRLVAQAYFDAGAASIATKSPTVARAHQRTALALAPSLFRSGKKLYVRDVRQAYTQSDTPLKRDVYLRISPTLARYLHCGPGKLLRVLKPLYGLPEAGLYWYTTYQRFHRELGMHVSTFDRCVFVSEDGVVVMQVDDTLGIVGDPFLEREEKLVSRFRAKPREILADGGTVTFNGLCISRKDHNLFVTTQACAQKDWKVPKTPEQCVGTRAAVQWIAGNTRPDLSGPTQLQAAAVLKPDADAYREMEKMIRVVYDTANDGLSFVPLDLHKLLVILHTDSSFGNATGGCSQLGYTVSLADGEKANLVDWQSSKSKRVSRSVMGAELLALAHGFDRALAVRHMVAEILGRDPQAIPIWSFVDSKTLFDLITRMSVPMERRLTIDAYQLQEAHINGEMSRLSWFPRALNTADPLTHKAFAKNTPLRNLMLKNELELSATGASTVNVGRND